MSAESKKDRLSDAELQRLQTTRVAVYANTPEFVPLIKAFADAGMIAGWRDVQYPAPASDPTRCYSGPFYNGSELVKKPKD